MCSCVNQAAQASWCVQRVNCQSHHETMGLCPHPILMPHPHLPDVETQCVQVKKCFLTAQVLPSRAQPHRLMVETGSLPAAHTKRPEQPGSHTSTQGQGSSLSLGHSAPSLFLPMLKTFLASLPVTASSVQALELRRNIKGYLTYKNMS